MNIPLRAVYPEGQAHRVEVKGVAVEVTPEKYLK